MAPAEIERETSRARMKPTRIVLNWALKIKLLFELKVTKVGQDLQARPKKGDCLPVEIEYLPKIKNLPAQ